MDQGVSRRALLSAAIFGVSRLMLPLRLSGWVDTSRITRDQHWREDLRMLSRELPEKAKPLEVARKRRTFLRRLKHLDQEVGSRTDNQILVGIMHSLAAIGDGHTNLSVDSYLFPFYPIWVYWFKEGIYVIRAGEQYRDLLGARLVKLGNASTGHLSNFLNTIIGHENEWFVKDLAQYLIISADIMNGAGFTSDPRQATFEFRMPDGTVRQKTLTAGNNFEHPDSLTARFLRYSKPDKNYWFQQLPGKKTIYFRYKHCEEMQELPFSTFQQQLLDAIRTTHCERLIIDLRDNAGGNSAILNPLISILVEGKEATDDLALYALIGRGTLSSAAMNAMDLKRRAAAVLVGEPSGAKPNQYGEIRDLELPNSHLRVQYSTRYWNYWPFNSDQSLHPDVLITETWKDFHAGKDAALEAALAHHWVTPLRVAFNQSMNGSQVPSQ